MMKIRYAKSDDLALVHQIDPAVTQAEFSRWAENAQVLLIYENDDFAGWLQYSLFLEKIPFVNRLYLLEEYRGLGDGTLTLLIWQRQMEELFFNEVMISCEVANTHAQELFEKLGYQNIGTLALGENAERIVYKKVLPKPEI